MKVRSEYTCPLELENGFLLNELWWQMEGHILDRFTLKGLYDN